MTGREEGVTYLRSACERVAAMRVIAPSNFWERSRRRTRDELGRLPSFTTTLPSTPTRRPSVAVGRVWQLFHVSGSRSRLRKNMKRRVDHLSSGDVRFLIYLPFKIISPTNLQLSPAARRRGTRGRRSSKIAKILTKSPEVAPKQSTKWIASTEVLHICASDSIRAVWKLDTSSNTKKILPRD